MKKKHRLRVFIVVSLLGAAAFFLSFAAERQSKLKAEKSESVSSIYSNGWKSAFQTKISINQPPEWMFRQILTDFSPFSSSGITSEMLDEMMKKTNGRGQLVRYRIIDNKISIVEQNVHVIQPRLEWITQALRDLIEIAPLPNIEFIISLEDAIDGEQLSAPVLAFAKHYNSDKVILIPDFEALSDMTVHLLQQVDRGIKKYPWQKKISKAFWRGATTGGEFSEQNFLTIPRSKAVTHSLTLPHLIDAKFTQLVQSPHPELIQEKFGSYFSKSISVQEHLKFKYQLLIDGNTCAYSRAYWQLFSNSVILKQSSPNIQWFYSLLKPYIHYIPLENDLSDLPAKIRWSQDHEKEIQKIINNAQNLALENLTKADIYYYLYLVLLEYAKLQKTAV